MRGFREHLVEHPFGVHGKPCQVERDADGIGKAQLAHEVGDLSRLRGVVELFDVLGAHAFEHLVHEGLTRFVVRLTGASCRSDGFGDVGCPHGDWNAVEIHGGQIGRHPFARRHRVGDCIGHAAFAFELCHMRFVVTLGHHARNQFTDRAAHHARLSQRRQHLIDIVQELLAGADHEHSGTVEHTAMRVEQVGGAMQGHCGLAGARSS